MAQNHVQRYTFRLFMYFAWRGKKAKIRRQNGPSLWRRENDRLCICDGLDGAMRLG